MRDKAVVRLAEIKVDCRGQNCPVPLVETKKALKRAAIGDVVEVTGDPPRLQEGDPDGADKVTIIKELPSIWTS